MCYFQYCHASECFHENTVWSWQVMVNEWYSPNVELILRFHPPVGEEMIFEQISGILRPPTKLL